MRDKVYLSWLTPPSPLPDNAPVVILAPGLNCYKWSLPGTSPYEVLMSNGYRVVVFHKRGIFPSAHLESPAFHIFGHPSDFEIALQHVASRWSKAPIHIVGLSSGNGLIGSHAVLYACGESRTSPPNLKSYLLFVGGADYRVAFAPEKASASTRLVIDYVLRTATQEGLLRANADVLRNADPQAYEDALASKSMQRVYNICNDRFCGYPKDRIDEANKRLNPFAAGTGALRDLQTPLLWVLTEDDPVMPGGPPDHWLEELHSLEMASLVLFKHGSHLPCYTAPFRPWKLERWADRMLIEWLEAVGGRESPHKAGTSPKSPPIVMGA